MFKNLLLILSLVILYCCSICAQNQLDSLIQNVEVVEKENRDSNLYKAYYEVIKSAYKVDVDTCIFYLKKSILFAEEIDYKPGLQKSSYLLSTIHMKSLNYEEAKKTLEICIQALPSANKRQNRCLKMAGDIFRDLSQFDQAKSYLLRAEVQGEEANDSTFLSTVYNAQGMLYESLQENDKAIAYYIKSAEIDKGYRNWDGYVITIGNIAALHLDDGDLKKAEQYLKEGRSLVSNPTDLQNSIFYQRDAGIKELQFKYDEALELFKQALIHSKNIEYSYAIASNYFNIAKMYSRQEKYKEANYNLSNGLTYVKSPKQYLNYYCSLTANLVFIGECAKASKWMELAKGYLKEVKSFVSIRHFYTTKAKYNSCMGLTKEAHTDIDTAFIYSDSIYFERKNFEAKKIEAQYQTRLKQDSINILTLQTVNQDVLLQRRNIGLGASFIVLLLIGLLAWVYKRYFESQKELNQILALENKELIFEKMELTKLNTLLETKLTVTSKEKIVSAVPKQVKIKSADKVYLLDPDQVRYIKAEDDGTRVYHDDTSKWTDMSLKEISTLFPENTFVQIFRSTIVNINHIGWVNSTSLKMKDGTELKISRTYKQKIKDAVIGNAS